MNSWALLTPSVFETDAISQTLPTYPAGYVPQARLELALSWI